MKSKAGLVAKLRMRQKRFMARSSLMGTCGMAGRTVAKKMRYRYRLVRKYIHDQPSCAETLGCGWMLLVGKQANVPERGVCRPLPTSAVTHISIRSDMNTDACVISRSPLTVLTNVIILTPCASSIVTALVLGSMALAVTGTEGTAVHSHILFTGLLWMRKVQVVEKGSRVLVMSITLGFSLGELGEGGGAAGESKTRNASHVNAKQLVITLGCRACWPEVQIFAW